MQRAKDKPGLMRVQASGFKERMDFGAGQRMERRGGHVASQIGTESQFSVLVYFSLVLWQFDNWLALGNE